MPAEDQMPNTDPLRFVAFYQDTWDDDGAAVSLAATGPAAVTLWHGVEEPRRSLGQRLSALDTDNEDHGAPPDTATPLTPGVRAR